jgi:hypothetical protein
MLWRGVADFVVLLVGAVPCMAGEPRVENPSFEVDVFKTYPGLARVNGGKITGWQFSGSVGLNPFWLDAPKRTRPQRPFVDNGITPHGRQVALMQNLCTLSQKIAGFEAGKRYVVRYRENARQTRRTEKPPRLIVTLGGETIVSEHDVRSVDDPERFTLPYDLVESAPFTAPEDGSFDLVFKTTVDGGVTVLVDKVEIKQVP